MTPVATETPAQRTERKLDALIQTVADQGRQLVRIEEATKSRAREAAQMAAFMSETLHRLEKDHDTEVDDRKADVRSVRDTLSKTAFVLFTAVLTFVGGVLLWLVTR